MKPTTNSWMIQKNIQIMYEWVHIWYGETKKESKWGKMLTTVNLVNQCTILVTSVNLKYQNITKKANCSHTHT